MIDEALQDEIVITVIATGFDKWGTTDTKSQEIIESLRNTMVERPEASQPQQTAMSGRVTSRTDYTADLDIPPFLRRNRD